MKINRTIFTSGDNNEKIIKIKTCRLLRPFFSTTLEIVEGHVVITYHQLFSAQRTELDIKDLYNVEIDSNLWFAELVFYSRLFIDNSLKIDKLWKKDAEAFQKEVQEIRKSNSPTIS